MKTVHAHYVLKWLIAKEYLFFSPKLLALRKNCDCSPNSKTWSTTSLKEYVVITRRYDNWANAAIHI